MKILAVNKFFYPKGGSETAFFGLNNLLRENGHEIIEFAMKDPRNYPSESEAFFVANIDYDGMPLPKKLFNAFKTIYSLEARRKVGKLLAKTRPDLAHLHIFQHQLTPAIIWEIKKQQIPLVNTVHDLKALCPVYTMLSDGKICERCKGGNYYHCIMQKCSKGSRMNSLVISAEAYFHQMINSYRQVDMFISPTLFYRQKFIEWGVNPERIVHIANFLDCGKFEPAYGTAAPYFLYFGRLAPEKGIFTLLRAMRQVKGLSLYLAGTGPLEEPVKEYLGNHNLQGQVKMLGYQTGAALKDLIREARFTVLPSEWYENGPYALLESMAYGKAVIGSRIGGIPEHIDDEETGLLFTAGAVDELAEKINRLAGPQAKVAQLGKNARYKLEKEFNAQLHYERVRAVYEKINKKK